MQLKKVYKHQQKGEGKVAYFFMRNGTTTYVKNVRTCTDVSRIEISLKKKVLALHHNGILTIIL